MTPSDDMLQELAQQVASRLLDLQLQMACAESCTGGWLAKTATDLPGSSHWFDRGFVTYSNESKVELLGVRPQTLATYGAVSEQTALEMAAGVLARSHAQVSIAITGIAGPGGATPGKPVGLVWFAWAGGRQQPVARSFRFDGDRDAVRRQAVAAAWQGLLARLA